MQRTEHKLTEKDLKNWDLFRVFEEAVERVFSKAALHPTFSDRARRLSYRSYLSLFLFGWLNPVVESLRGLCAVTELERVQEEVCRGKVSPASFSEMQHLLEPELLRQVFGEVVQQTPGNPRADVRLVHLNLIA